MGKRYSAPPEWLEKIRAALRGGGSIPYCPEWDHYVRVAITLGMVKPYYDDSKKMRASEYYVRIGDYKVWVKNYPYAFGCVEAVKDRPSFATMKLLLKEVKRVQLEASIIKDEANEN
jgi:hypothetical protein